MPAEDVAPIVAIPTTPERDVAAERPVARQAQLLAHLVVAHRGAPQDTLRDAGELLPDWRREIFDLPAPEQVDPTIVHEGNSAGNHRACGRPARPQRPDHPREREGRGEVAGRLHLPDRVGAHAVGDLVGDGQHRRLPVDTPVRRREEILVACAEVGRGPVGVVAGHAPLHARRPGHRRDDTEIEGREMLRGGRTGDQGVGLRRHVQGVHPGRGVGEDDKVAPPGHRDLGIRVDRQRRAGTRDPHSTLEYVDPVGGPPDDPLAPVGVHHLSCIHDEGRGLRDVLRRRGHVPQGQARAPCGDIRHQIDGVARLPRRQRGDVVRAVHALRWPAEGRPLSGHLRAIHPRPDRLERGVLRHGPDVTQGARHQIRMFALAEVYVRRTP